jgi:outer membrane receptor protein involved in Fe transport
VFEISRHEPISATALQARQIAALPIPGEDLFRAVSTVVGTASNDISAEFAVRGGRTDELLVLIDGVELYEPFHLKDLNSALSLVTPQAVESLELHTGGFSAAYGDRLSGILDLRTVRPGSHPAGHLGLSPVDLSASVGDTSAGRGVGWFAAGRLGVLRETIRLAEGDREPEFDDLFAKVSWSASPSHDLSFDGLFADDEYRQSKESEELRSSYVNRYLWLNHEGHVAGSAFLETRAYLGRLEERRSGVGTEDDAMYLIEDRRFVDILGLRQDWSVLLSPRHSLQFGIDVRQIDAAFDYRRDLERGERVGLIAAPPELHIAVAGRPSGRQDQAYVSHRLQARSLTLESGLRFYESRLTDAEHLSPRLHAVCALGERSALRAGWGHYYQSLRPHELRVEEGETTFPRDERAEQVVVGFDHRFSSGVHARIEAYDRRITAPRTRYDNLLDPIRVFPELALDRVRIAAERSRARGLELSARGANGPWDWSATYAWSRSRDSLTADPLSDPSALPSGDVSAEVEVPRPMDQPHAVQFSVNRRLGSAWDVGLLGVARSGWPTTPVRFLVVDQGDEELYAVPEVGALYGARMPHYVRFDLRVQRRFQTSRGQFALAFDLLNAFDRHNVRGYEFSSEFAPEDQRPGDLVTPRELDWSGVIPTISASWRW